MPVLPYFVSARKVFVVASLLYTTAKIIPLWTLTDRAHTAFLTGKGVACVTMPCPANTTTLIRGANTSTVLVHVHLATTKTWITSFCPVRIHNRGKPSTQIPYVFCQVSLLRCFPIVIKLIQHACSWRVSRPRALHRPLHLHLRN